MNNTIELFGVRDAAKLIGLNAPPRLLSDLFHQHRLDVSRCPVVGGRRLIPADYLEGIVFELRRSGYDVRDPPEKS